jgi:hypothetical protein
MKHFVFLAAAFCSGLSGIAQQPEKPQVLFSGPPKTQAATPQPVGSKSSVTDAERRAVAIAAWDLDLHLSPREQSLEAHARVTVRNDGSTPLLLLPLQLSSTLKFETIGLAGKRLVFTSSIVNSDADHTGQLTEAAISLPAPLAPGSDLTLDVNYGGTIPLSAKRLLAIGAPEAQAQASDWDRVSADFTGLRGFGNVVWYPVSSVPALLGDEAKLRFFLAAQNIKRLVRFLGTPTTEPAVAALAADSNTARRSAVPSPPAKSTASDFFNTHRPTYSSRVPGVWSTTRQFSQGAEAADSETSGSFGALPIQTH